MKHEEVPDNRRGMQRVPSDRVVVGDWIYRKGADCDYMMIVEQRNTCVREGRQAIRIGGGVYKLEGEGAGPQAYFLGSAQARPVIGGPYQWYLEAGGNVVRGCSLEDADFEMP